MNKKLLILGISAISLLLMGLVVFNPFARDAHVSSEGASDFYQRHPDWVWTANQNVKIPLTGDVAFPDYFQRHPELAGIAVNGSGASDYFERHPELIPAAKSDIDLTDYYFRHLDD